LPDLPADLQAWLQSIVLHNLVVAGRTDAAGLMAPDVWAAVDGSAGREARFAVGLSQAGLGHTHG